MDREVCSLILKRWEVIDSLRDSAKDKRTLESDLDCSRSTINRAVRELESIGVVEYVHGEYEITSLGQTLSDGFDELMDTVELRLELEPFLQWVPDDEFDLELKYLHDAEVLLPKAGDPYSMINRHVRVVEQTEAHQCLLPLVGLHGHKAAHKQIVDNGATGEIIVGPDALDTLLSDSDYAELTQEMAATGRFSLFQYDGDIPYFVGVLDDVVQIGVDDDGTPRALLESQRSQVRAWAEDTFEEYKRLATPVTISEESTKARA